jgi:two-component system LytT family response regulator
MNIPTNYGHPLNESISIKVADVIRIIYYCEIVFIQSDDNYAYIHAIDHQPCMICKPLKDFEEQLCESQFFRTHKSFIVNLSFIKEIRKKKESEVWLTTGEKIPVSRRRLPGLRKRLK